MIHFKLIVFLFMLFGTSVYSQDTVQRLNSLFAKHGADPAVNKIFVNKSEKILDIDGVLIPLNDTSKFVTERNKTENGIKIKAYIEFECEGNCIYEAGEYIAGIGYAFKSKEGAYEFLDMIYKLEKEFK